MILTVPSKDVGTSLKRTGDTERSCTQSIKLECLYIAGEMKNFTHIEKKYFKWRDKIPCDRDITLKVG